MEYESGKNSFYFVYFFEVVSPPSKELFTSAVKHALDRGGSSDGTPDYPLININHNQINLLLSNDIINFEDVIKYKKQNCFFC